MQRQRPQGCARLKSKRRPPSAEVTQVRNNACTVLQRAGQKNLYRAQQLLPQRRACLKHERRQHGQRRRAHAHQHAAGQVADTHAGAPACSDTRFYLGVTQPGTVVIACQVYTHLGGMRRQSRRQHAAALTRSRQLAACKKDRGSVGDGTYAGAWHTGRTRYAVQLWQPGRRAPAAPVVAPGRGMQH